MAILSDYFENDRLRGSFNRLAIDTFSLDFEPWHQNGIFHGRYHPCSWEENGEILANISANEFEFQVDGVSRKAVQLGTVMTRPDRRRQGLSRKLMEHVLAYWQAKVDFIFLLANSTVLDFYPRFGFRRIPEICYTLKVDAVSPGRLGRKADFKQEKEEILAIAAQRLPVSPVFAPQKDIWPLEAYLADANMVWLEDGGIAVWETAGDVLVLADVLSVKPFAITDVLSTLPLQGFQSIRLHFPAEEIPCRREILKTEDGLFVLGSPDVLPKDFCILPTSHT
ncbi:MAG: GNAT family N-acetyltransferase [Oscillospiraceae bacterium]|nr:GNAT family N-acetyltransferase [Oscillospiraceae bacterium]